MYIGIVGLGVLFLFLLHKDKKANAKHREELRSKINAWNRLFHYNKIYIDNEIKAKYLTTYILGYEPDGNGVFKTNGIDHLPEKSELRDEVIKLASGINYT
ncbi:TPA: hypothetical protein P0E24_001744 [Vibrio campbellii]|nr:hypothetical protein [Vibrio campbellii]HDM8242678.1 hypothetical protein [Vibrio campbellii]